MTIPLELIESDAWPVLRQKIAAERGERLNAFLKIATQDPAVARLQGFVHALDWMLEEAAPKPPAREDDDD